MLVLREQIGKRIKGALMEDEDWWYLCLDTDNDCYFVRHEWSNVDAYDVAKCADSGSSEHDADTWTGEGPEKIEAAKVRLPDQAKA